MLKKLSKIFAVAALGFFGSPAASAQDSAPADTAQKNITEASVIYVAFSHVSKDTTGLAALRYEIGRTPMGEALLHFADTAGIPLSFEDRMYRRSNIGEYDPEDSTMTLQRGLTMTEKVVVTVHELWHAWQEASLNKGGGEQDCLVLPEHRWNLRQFMEADARAFSTWFLADRRVRLGEEQLEITTRYIDFEQKIASSLAEEMSGDGLSAEEYREIALKPCFNHLDGYVTRHYNLAKAENDWFYDQIDAIRLKMDHGRYDAARHQLDRLQDVLSATPTAETIEKILRRYGATSLDTSAATAFSDSTMTSQNIMHDYPYMSNEYIRMRGYREHLPTLISERNDQFREMQQEVMKLSARWVREAFPAYIKTLQLIPKNGLAP